MVRDVINNAYKKFIGPHIIAVSLGSRNATNVLIRSTSVGSGINAAGTRRKTIIAPTCKGGVAINVALSGPAALNIGVRDIDRAALTDLIRAISPKHAVDDRDTTT